MHEEIAQTNNMRYQVRILIRHPTIDLEFITKILMLSPDNYWKSGDKIITPSGRILKNNHKDNMWSYSFRVLGNRHFSKSVKEIIDIFDSNSKKLENIMISGGRIDLTINLPGNINIGDSIPWNELFRIYNLKINLGFEVFPDFS